MSFDIVIPTTGRSSLLALLERLDHLRGPRPGTIVVADDTTTSRVAIPARRTSLPVRTVCSRGRGPAAARNIGYRSTNADWIVFLDDDVLPEGGWRRDLESDICVSDDVAGVQGRVRVPVPSERKPTDWERNVRSLEHSPWITADMAYRRTALDRVAGFDERFRSAYREDADIALRITAAGYRLLRGHRSVVHPPGRADWWTAVRKQRGNADDVLMWALHGASWKRRAGATPGRWPVHVASTLALAAAAGLAGVGRKGPATACAGLWAALTADFAWRRIAPGPRNTREILSVISTSAAIPPVAVGHRLKGVAVLPRRLREPPRSPCLALLFDRDGTLVEDVPYNGDPAKVVPVAGATEALDLLRRHGAAIGVISNQSGIGRGLITHEQARAVNRRVEELLGPFDVWAVCPHAPGEGCTCRKPAPGLLLSAARSLGVAPSRCLVIGDIEADMEAARRAGARGILVPNSRTLAREVESAAWVAPDLLSAVRMVLEELSP